MGLSFNFSSNNQSGSNYFGSYGYQQALQQLQQVSQTGDWQQEAASLYSLHSIQQNTTNFRSNMQSMQQDEQAFDPIVQQENADAENTQPDPSGDDDSGGLDVMA